MNKEIENFIKDVKVEDILENEVKMIVSEDKRKNYDGMFFAVMHPKKYRQLLTETKEIIFSRGTAPNSYKGIFLLRTEDLEEWNIEVFYKD